ncbi:hypothetical protein [Halobacillus mangrovi]
MISSGVKHLRTKNVENTALSLVSLQVEGSFSLGGFRKLPMVRGAGEE